MKPPLLFVFLSTLYFLFSHPILAQLSDQEKREFIENLAKPIQERRAFYRWQSEESRDTLIKDKKLTKERFKYFMRKDVGVLAGAGLYVAEDMHSSRTFGDTIIQVEVKEGMKYIDLTDVGTVSKLLNKGISEKDVYDLNPNIGIKYNSQHWVFKTREGVAFQPFSGKGIPLEELHGPALQEKPHFIKSIRGDILKRAEKNISTIIGSPFVDLLEEEYGSKYVRNAINRHKNSLNNVDEINGWLKYANHYLNKGDMKKLIKKATLLPIISMKQSEALLENLAQTGLISKANVTEIVKKTPRPRNIEEAVDFIKNAPFLSIKDKEKIFSEISITSIDDFVEFIRNNKNLSYIPSRSIKKIVRQITPLIENVEQGTEILYQSGKHLSSLDRKRIVNKTIPHISHIFEGMQFFYSMEKHHPEPADIKKVVRKMIPLIHNEQGGRHILYKTGKYLEPSDRKKVVKKTLPLIISAEEGTTFLSDAGKYLDSQDKKQVVNKTISLITSVNQGRHILNKLKDSLEASDKKRIAKKIIPFIANADEGRNILVQAREYLDPLDRKRIVNKTIPLIMNAREGAKFLDETGKYLDPSDKKRVVNRIIPLIKNAEDGKTILFRVGRYLEPSERKRVVKALTPLINNAKGGKDILFLVGGYLEPSDIKQIAKKIIQFTGQKGFEEIEKLLSEEEYKELVAEFENKQQRKLKVSSGKDSDKKIQRLNCLKEQLRQVSLK